MQFVDEIGSSLGRVLSLPHGDAVIPKLPWPSLPGTGAGLAA